MKTSIESYLEYEAASTHISVEDNSDTEVGFMDLPDIYKLEYFSMDNGIQTDVNISQEGIKDYIKKAGNDIHQHLDNQLDGIRHFITFVSVTELKLKKYQRQLKEFPSESQSLYFKANPFFRYGEDGKVVSSMGEYIEKLKETNDVVKTMLKTTSEFTNKKIDQMKSAMTGSYQHEESLKTTGDAIISYADDMGSLDGTSKLSDGGKTTITKSPTYLGMFSIKVVSPKSIGSGEKEYSKSVSLYDVNITKDQVKYKGDMKEKVHLVANKESLSDLIDTSLSMIGTFKEFDNVTNRLTERAVGISNVINKIAFVASVPMYIFNAGARLTYRNLELISKNNPRAFVITKHHIDNILNVVEEFMHSK